MFDVKKNFRDYIFLKRCTELNYLKVKKTNVFPSLNEGLYRVHLDLFDMWKQYIDNSLKNLNDTRFISDKEDVKFMISSYDYFLTILGEPSMSIKIANKRIDTVEEILRLVKWLSYWFYLLECPL